MCQAKALLFKNLDIKAEVKKKAWIFNILTSKALAKYVELQIEGEDVIFTDNYFDLVPGNKKVIEVKKDTLTKIKDVKSLKDNLKIRSLFETVEQL